MTRTDASVPAPAGTDDAPAPSTGPRRLLTLAPGHAPWDERVLRTVEAGRGFETSVLALDREVLAAAGPEAEARLRARLGGTVRVVPLPRWPRMPGLSRLTRHLYAHRIALLARELRPDVVHIHESGILGLMVAARVRRVLPRARILFDYHDWLPDEIAHLSGNRPAVYALSLRAWMPRLRRMARAVDVAVCISPGHAAWTRETLGISRTVVVQNVRRAGAAPALGRAEHRRELVWCGHVMRLRRLELLVDVLGRLRDGGTDAWLSIFGDEMEPAYSDELRARARALGLEGRVVFHGRYGGDADLAARLGPGSVGVHPAHAEALETGINRITSGNKFFSYLALGLPVLLEAPLHNMRQIADEAGAGAAFDGVDACAAAARRIWDTPGAWERMSARARAAARIHSAEAVVDLLESLYGEVWPGTDASPGRARSRGMAG